MEKNQIGLITSVVINVILAILLIFFIYKLNASAGAVQGSGTISPESKILLAPNLNCVQVNSGDALLIIDVQNDFMPERPFTAQNPRHAPAPEDLNGTNLKGGSLGVGEAKDIVAHINPLITTFESAKATIIYSLDWHPSGHCSFDAAAKEPQQVKSLNTPGICRDDGSIKRLNTEQLYRWPIHCVQGSWGAKFDPHLNISKTEGSFVVKKGFWEQFDSYSAFGGRLSTHIPANDNVIVDASASSEDMKQATKRVQDILKERKVKRLFVVGIATDFCVNDSIGDAILTSMTEIPGLAIASVKEAVGAVFKDSVSGVFSSWQSRGVAVLSEKNKEGKPLFNTQC